MDISGLSFSYALQSNEFFLIMLKKS